MRVISLITYFRDSSLKQGYHHKTLSRIIYSSQNLIVAKKSFKMNSDEFQAEKLLKIRELQEELRHTQNRVKSISRWSIPDILPSDKECTFTIR